MKTLAIRHPTIHRGLEPLPAMAFQQHHGMFTGAPLRNPSAVVLLENGLRRSNRFEVTVKHLERQEILAVRHGLPNERNAALATATTGLHLSVAWIGKLDAEMSSTERLP